MKISFSNAIATKYMKEILPFILTALYMLEMWILIPIFILLWIITGKDLSKTKQASYLVNWFYNYIERITKK